MGRRVITASLAVLAATIGAAGCFVSTTVLMEELPDTLLVAATCVGALAVTLSMAGPGAVMSAVRRGGRPLLAGVAGGAASFAAAPLLVLSQRASDAPPGTEVLLFTTSAWGLVVCVAALVASAPPRSPVAVAASLLGGVGGVVVLANWERPSSLSPFVRFPEQHLVMLFAGVVFALGAVSLVRAAKSMEAPVTAALASLGACVVAVPLAVPALGGAGPGVSRLSGALVVLAVFGVLFLVGWVRASASGGLEWASASLMLVPAVLTGLSFAERSLTVYGPNPIRWAAAGAGIALSLAAGAVLWPAHAFGPDSAARQEPAIGAGAARAWLLAVALTVVLALASMATGGLRAEIAGAFGEEYRAAWTMLGVETAVGWLALATAACAGAAAWDALRGLRRSAWTAAVLACAAPLTYPFLADTPLRTATRWVPADVQQTLGTEYARITFVPMVEPLRLLALVAAVAVGLAVIFRLVRTRPSQGESEGTA